MALVLRKVLDSVLSRSAKFSSASAAGGGGGSPVSPMACGNPPLGDFDQLPIDVLMHVLQLLGPKNAARTSVLCKSWRALVSNNDLWIFFFKNGEEPWDALLFAETYLKSRSMMYLQYSLQSSFMNMYSGRSMVPGSVVIDGGSGYCKYGWSKYPYPSGRCATFLEFGSLEVPMHARLRHFFSTIYSRMQVKASTQPIIVSLPICHSDNTEDARASRSQLREAIYSVLFEMNAPAVCAINQAVLALYAARQTSGIVVNIGFNVTSVVPILRGKVMHEVGIEILGQGALKVTGFLREMMLQSSIGFESLYTVRTIKEKLCYVAADYDAELRKDTKASCEVSGEGWFTLSKERFQAGEILFQPQMGGLRTMGLHQAVGLCMDHCVALEVAGDDTWYKTVVLAGGTSCLPGLSERLEKELRKLLPAFMTEGLKVIPPPFGTDSAWFGAKAIGNVSTFLDGWCITRKQFRQKFRRNSAW